MAVSLLSGGVNGVQLGILMLRASIGAAVFTALAIGINLLLMNLFPEFFDAPNSEDTRYNEVGGSLGSSVDLTLPPEEPERSGPVDGPAGGDTGQFGARVSGYTAPVSESDRFPDSFPDVEEVRSESQDDKSSGLGSERDPEELAQAIHTVITRDEKG